MMVIALFLLGLSIVLAYAITTTAWNGICLRKKYREHGDYDPVIFKRHKKWVCISFAMILLTVLVIETVFRLLTLPYVPLFAVHLPISILFCIFFGFTWWFNGTKKDSPAPHPNRHKILARLTWLFGILSVATGDAIVLMVIWPR